MLWIEQAMTTPVGAIDFLGDVAEGVSPRSHGLCSEEKSQIPVIGRWKGWSIFFPLGAPF
jgi:hypothetical protein